MPQVQEHDTKKKAYFIGIAGAGMSATAQLLKTLGWEVSGSDQGAYPPITTYLEKRGIPYTTVYNKNNVPMDADLVVVGKHAGLTKEENEEVAFVYNNNFTIQSFPEVLNKLTKDTGNIVCVGSHGKSTCAGILAWCLAEQDPSFFIGAVPYNLETNAQSGKGNLFVLEGDEYPASNTDNTSKFLYYNASDVLLTSLEHDHLNIFKTQEEYTAPFLRLIESLPTNGLVVASGKDRQIQKTIPQIQRKVITYSTDEDIETDWYAKNITYGEETTFDVYRDRTHITTLTTTLLGQHNVENIIGASVLLLEKKYSTEKDLQKRIHTFTGIERRLDKKITDSVIPLYEGFGSSQSKVRSAIEAIKTHYDNKRLLVIFEPHAISWRKKEYTSKYQKLFKEANKVYVYIDSVPEPKDNTTISGSDILTHIQKESGADAVQLHKDCTPLLQEIQQEDIILFLSSGNMDGALQTLIQTLKQQFSPRQNRRISE